MVIQNLYQDIGIAELRVNPENPRMIEELENEDDAINFLLSDIPERMKKLAQDIAEHGAVYDPPLICKDGAHWKVFDGNRRVSCVKLLLNPQIANDQAMQRFFEKLASNYKGRIPVKINCRIETDQVAINDILERRHAGGESGIGQMPWKPEEKANFYYREGLEHKPKFGTELSRLLQDKGVIKKGDRIKVSIFDRLLSSEGYRNMVGLTFKNRRLDFYANEKEALTALTRIVEDAKSGVINLNRAWANQDKSAYLDNLKNQGILPSKPSHDGKDSSGKKNELRDPGEEKPKVKKDQPYARPHLIPEGLIFKFVKNDGTARIRNVVAELQSDLYFSRHMNAIAVLFRVLIEMSVDYYVEIRSLTFSAKDKHGPSLATKFLACLEDMVQNGDLKDKDRKVLVKFSQPEQFLSADTFHAWVHHRLAHPVQTDLIAMWDQIQPFIMNCIHVDATKKQNAA